MFSALYSKTFINKFKNYAYGKVISISVINNKEKFNNNINNYNKNRLFN